MSTIPPPLPAASAVLNNIPPVADDSRLVFLPTRDIRKGADSGIFHHLSINKYVALEKEAKYIRDIERKVYLLSCMSQLLYKYFL